MLCRLRDDVIAMSQYDSPCRGNERYFQKCFAIHWTSFSVFLFRISFCSLSFSRPLVKICHKLSTAKYLRYVLLSLRLAANVNVDSLIGLATPLFQCLYIWLIWLCFCWRSPLRTRQRQNDDDEIELLLNCKMNLCVCVHSIVSFIIILFLILINNRFLLTSIYGTHGQCVIA